MLILHFPVYRLIYYKSIIVEGDFFKEGLLDIKDRTLCIIYKI